MRNRHDPDGNRLPIKLDSTCNGEFAPIPLNRLNQQANTLAHRQATDAARRLGLSRRRFLVTACGAASTLLAFNTVNAAAGKTGGFFELDPDASHDLELAMAKMRKKEFIFDVQGHYVDPNGKWLESVPDNARPFSFAEKAGCALAEQPGQRSYLQCLGPDEFIKDVFLDSDTDMMVLSFVPSRREAEPLTIDEAANTREIVNRMGRHRLLLHGRVNPNQDGDIEAMDELAERYQVAAWKTYTQWGPDGKGFFLHEDPGLAFIEKARNLGVPVIAIHKGIPFGRRSYEHSLCDDIGIVAKQYPDVSFLIYHSGYVPGQDERPYDAEAGRDGIDSLIRSLQASGLGPGSNVYAELGSTWRMLMRDPDSAAHGLGKLLRYVGPDNVVWGTDSIWYGSPQDQIQAFRTFQISDEFQERYGYPAITSELRQKVFGLNAMKPYGLDLEDRRRYTTTDWIERDRTAYQETPDPHYRTYGPRTRREFLNLLRRNGDQPA
ncbi:MAG: amidohydrolase family protein [Gammaproteobacteria bacterium]|nr:amidohydrolase family protein [Gammaproteobacteria bacterium]